MHHEQIIMMITDWPWFRLIVLLEIYFVTCLLTISSPPLPFKCVYHTIIVFFPIILLNFYPWNKIKIAKFVISCTKILHKLSPLYMRLLMFTVITYICLELVCLCLVHPDNDITVCLFVFLFKKDFNIKEKNTQRKKWLIKG